MKIAKLFYLVIFLYILIPQEILARDWIITQITHDDIKMADADPSFHNGQVAWWRGTGGHPHKDDPRDPRFQNREIYFWNGSEIIQITNNSVPDVCPSLYNGKIAWQQWDGNDWEIMLWDGSNIQQITNNQVDDHYADIFGDSIAWSGWDGTDYEIYYYHNGKITQVTDNYFDDIDPDLNNGQIAWVGGETSSKKEVWFWDGMKIIQVTNNDTPDWYATLYNGTIAWWGYDGVSNDSEIFFWNGFSITQITYNDVNDYIPSLWDGQIAWRMGDPAKGEDTFIYFWDGKIVERINTNGFSVRNSDPSLWDGRIAWHGFDGNDYEIFLAIPEPEPPAQPQQLTNNDLNDYRPTIWNGQIAWDGFVTSTEHELMLYDGEQIRQLTDTPGYEYRPVIWEGKIAYRTAAKICATGEKQTEIYLWDGFAFERLTNNEGSGILPTSYGVAEDDSYAMIRNNAIVWRGYDGDYEIYYRSPCGEVMQITNNSTYDNYPFIDIDGIKIVWRGEDPIQGDKEIYLWDGQQIINISNNNTDDHFPTIFNGKIVWSSFKNGHWQLMLFKDGVVYQLTNYNYANFRSWLDGEDLVWNQIRGDCEYVMYMNLATGEVRQISNTECALYRPCIHNKVIVWSGWDGNDYEIYRMIIQ